MNERARCKACGASFESDEYFSAERNLGFHISEEIQFGDMKHIFAYPEKARNIKDRVPEYIQRCQQVSFSFVDIKPINFDNDYFSEARMNGRVLYIVFSDGKRYYIRDYKVHLLVEDADVERLKRITKMARAKFYWCPTHFFIAKIDNKYAIISRNFDSDIDEYCQNVYEGVYEGGE